VKLSVGNQLLVNVRSDGAEVHRRIALSDPGIDDYRNGLLWSPEKPTLIDALIQLWYKDKLIDEVRSYTAMRCVAIQRDRFMLNGRPYYLRLVLDQGYWPDTLMTAPSDEALRRDVELVAWDSTVCASTRKLKTPFLVLGGCAGTAGLGGDAQRLSIHLPKRWSGLYASGLR